MELFAVDDLCDLGYIVVEISRAENYQYVEVATLDEVEHIVFVDEAALDARPQIVVDELAGYSRDRLFACGVDVGENHFVELAKCIGKVAVEVAGASVEMRLEYGRYLAVIIELTYAPCTLEYFFRVVGLVGNQHMALVLDLEVESAFHPVIGLHAIAQFLSVATVELCHSHSGDSVLNIDRNRMSELYVLDVLDG